jgi:hypothetical protein
MAKQTDKQYLELWNQFRDNISKATPIDLNETAVERKKRVARLEKNPEEWFKYYFPNFYTAEPAPFHIAATRRVLNNPEWYEVRSWARGLSKSGRTMMEVLYLALTRENDNIIMVSSTYDNAERLLLPYKAILESNNRIINDYGQQQSIGNWEAGEFITRKGVAFRALGAGQSPRGTRKDAIRPTIILIDDIDTDEECRNEDRIKVKVKWIDEALIPTRDISRALLILACGNIIASFCCITEMAKKADKHDIVNIRDAEGKSTWPQKNTEAHIDRVLGQITDNAGEKEYFNNPIIEGEIFETVTYAKAPKISSCEMVVVYFDPSTSNKDKKKTGGKSTASYKSGIITGYKKFKFYTYWIRLEQTNNNEFVNWIFQADKFLSDNNVEPKAIFIENNSLQDPHYTQVIKPAMYKMAEDEGLSLPPLREDTRKKGDKIDRIDGTLQPLDKQGNLLFDEKLKGDKHMKKMESQMLGVSENAKHVDGPDTLEGAVWIMKNKIVRKKTTYRHQPRESRKH